MQRENAEALHLAQFPFQLMRQFLYFFGFVGMVLYAIFRSQVGWMIDIASAGSLLWRSTPRPRKSETLRYSLVLHQLRITGVV
jgi:hypothetical protein